MRSTIAAIERGLLADGFLLRQLGNFPQAFSHVGLINTAYNLSPAHRAPAAERRRSRSPK